MLPHMKYEGKEASSQVLVQRKGAEVGLARLKKALKRKLCFIPHVVSNKYLFCAFMSDQGEQLAQNSSIPFSDIRGTDGHALPPVSLHPCSLCSCRQLLGKEVVVLFWRC